MAIFWVAFLHMHLLGSIYLAYKMQFVIQLCINNWFLEIAQKYDFKKLQGSEGSNPNWMHGSGLEIL